HPRIHLLPLFVTDGLLLDAANAALPEIMHTTGSNITSSVPLGSHLADVLAPRLIQIQRTLAERSARVPQHPYDEYMPTLIFLALPGFAAQLVDGGLALGFGVTSTPRLIFLAGLGPAQASAGRHAAQLGTTLVPGFNHWRFGNV